MKNRFLLIIIALVISNLSFSQKEKDRPLQITPYFGLSVPQSELSNFSDNEIAFGVSIDKFLSSKFALGLDVNFQSNEFKNPLDFSSLTNSFSVVSNTLNKWEATTITFGSTYKLGRNKFNAELYVKGGLSFIKSPAQQTAITGLGIGDVNIFELKDKSYSSFGFNSGIRFNYNINDRLSLFINPQYLFSNSEIEIFKRDISSETLTNPDMLVQDGGTLCYVNPSYLNVNAGIKFIFEGSNKGEENEEETETKKICQAAELFLPANGKKYFLDGKERPIFSWESSKYNKASYYIVHIFDDNEKEILTKTINSNSLKHNKELESLYKRFATKDGTKILWQVESVFDNGCENEISETNVLLIALTVPGTVHNIHSLECDTPAYDSNGNLRITGVIDFFTSFESETLTVTSITINTGTTTISIPITDLYDCSNGTPVTSVVVLPGSPTISYCFNTEIPLSATSIDSEVNGTISTASGVPLPQTSTAFTDEVPDCACNTCEKWEYNDTVHTLSMSNVQGHPFNFQAVQELQIFGVDPIIEVKAEIISVQHVANDPQCYTCTKHENQMGLFSFGTIQPREIYNSSEWAFNGNGVIGRNNGGGSIDENDDKYTNQIIWRAKDPTKGIDFSNKNRFVMPISLPNPSSLDCCEHKYKVCIRYTFIDINCITCSYDQCYVSDGKSTSIVIGNPFGGTSNMSNTPFKKN